MWNQWQEFSMHPVSKQCVYIYKYICTYIHIYIYLGIRQGRLKRKDSPRRSTKNSQWFVSKNNSMDFRALNVGRHTAISWIWIEKTRLEYQYGSICIQSPEHIQRCGRNTRNLTGLKCWHITIHVETSSCIQTYVLQPLPHRWTCSWVMWEGCSPNHFRTIPSPRRIGSLGYNSPKTTNFFRDSTAWSPKAPLIIKLLSVTDSISTSTWSAWRVRLFMVVMVVHLVKQWNMLKWNLYDTFAMEILAIYIYTSHDNLYMTGFFV